jgi:hypothetical protein
MAVRGDADWPRSAVRAADAAFTALCTGPDPLSLDCDALGDGLGLPPGIVALPALREWMLSHPRHYAARDAVWRELILRARLHGPAWVIAAVGMAMPALTRFAGRLAAGYRGDPNDLDAELLTGFLEMLRGRLDLTGSGLYARLCFGAWRAGRAARAADTSQVPVEDLDRVTGPRSPGRPYGHPDLLVERAVTLGVIDEQDAALFIEVRLAHRAIEPIAAAAGLSTDLVRRRLDRAAARIAEALTEGLLTGVVSPAEATRVAARAEHRARVRAGKRAASGATPPAAA